MAADYFFGVVFLFLSTDRVIWATRVTQFQGCRWALHAVDA